MGKKPLLIYLLVFSILLINTLVFGQEEKFGKIDESILKMTRYEKDTNARALVLFDVGKQSIEFDGGNFYVVYKRHKRIKIFNKNGYDQADLQILYFDYNEVLYDFEAVTYTLENDEVVKYEIEKDVIFEESISGDLMIKKIAFPKISEGVVIEYEYKISSNLFDNLREWSFQGSVPCLWSEYTTIIPEYFNYNMIAQGDIKYDKYTKSTKSDYINNYINYTNYVSNFVIKDVPVFNSENYISTPGDYTSKINYQLASYQYPNQQFHEISNTWGKIAEKMMKSEYFGSQILKTEFKQGLLDSILTLNTPEQKIESIYNFVKNNIKWNDNEYIYVQTGVHKVLEKKIGNIADINLLLTKMLKKAGFEVYPVILGTKERGAINPNFPSLNKFNYVVTLLKFNDKNILLDASRPFLPMGMLPYQCLNGQGLVIKEKDFEWIDLQSDLRAFQSSNVVLNLDEEGMITGDIHTMDEGYSALEKRVEISKYSEKEFIEKEIKEGNQDYKIQSFAIENSEEIAKPLKAKYKIEIESELMGDRLYLNPVLFKNFDENPFRLEERKYPIDFNYPITDNYYLTLTIPDTYEVEDLPKSLICVLPDDAGKFNYLIGKTGNKLQLKINLYIKKVTFLPEEYKPLKEFFTQFIAKQTEQIVLKKIK